MLSTEAAGLVVQGAKGLIKLTRRVDLILAEKAAVEGPLGVSPPVLAEPPTDPQARKALRKLLGEEHDPPLSDADRAEIQSAIDDQPDLLRPLMARWLPEQAMGRTLDLDGAFVKALQARHPGLAEDPDLMLAAFYVSAEVDTRQRSYTWRIALSVADVVMDFGAENAALFTRDRGLQTIVASVLKRFGDAELHATASSRALLRAALGATLAAALDVRAVYDPGSPWVGGLLDALVRAREAAPEGERDEFLVGLVEGRGYPGLVAAVLEVAGGRLNDEGAESFRQVASDVLVTVADIAREKQSFRRFFEDHWGDILRAGLSSVETHGPALFAGANPLLTKVLVSVSGELATSPRNRMLGPDTLDAVVRAATAAVVANPELVDDLVDEAWLHELIGSVADTVTDAGLKASLNPEGLEQMLRSALDRFAERPELIVAQPGLARELVRGVLKKVGDVGVLGVEELAGAALSGALGAVSDNPGLVELKYPELVAEIAGGVAELVEARGISKVQGVEILTTVTVAVAENPALFLELERSLADGVVRCLVDAAAENRAGLIAGTALAHALGAVLTALSRSGRAALKNHPQAVLLERLSSLLAAGLVRAEKELGNRLDRSAVPRLLGELVLAWARGEIATIDPDNDNFRRLFSEIAERTAA